VKWLEIEKDENLRKGGTILVGIKELLEGRSVKINEAESHKQNYV
jgi:hypothetical protein